MQVNSPLSFSYTLFTFCLFPLLFLSPFDSFSGGGYARDYWCKRSSRKPMRWIEQV